MNAQEYDIVGGILNVSQIATSGIIKRVKTIIAHEEYNKPIQHNNDIAIVQLEDPLEETISIGVIKIAYPGKS